MGNSVAVASRCLERNKEQRDSYVADVQLVAVRQRTVSDGGRCPLLQRDINSNPINMDGGDEKIRSATQPETYTNRMSINGARSAAPTVNAPSTDGDATTLKMSDLRRDRLGQWTFGDGCDAATGQVRGLDHLRNPALNKSYEMKINSSAQIETAVLHNDVFLDVSFFVCIYGISPLSMTAEKSYSMTNVQSNLAE
ncbi:Protein of unknown function [Gryllus bimaculatus]|nr:Protein of unknown function [Gryllus bimaculatus]